MVMSIIVWWGGTHANPNPKLRDAATSIIAFSSTDGGFVWNYAGIILDASGCNDFDIIFTHMTPLASTSTAAAVPSSSRVVYTSWRCASC